MSLKDLNKELYRPDSEIEKRKHKESQFALLSQKHASPKKFQEKKSWTVFGAGLTDNQKRVLKAAVVIAAAVFLFSIVFIAVSKFKQTAFSDEKVTVEIEGPKEIGSNQLAEYKIKYKNNNRVSLENAEILLNYTENFQPEHNDKLKPAGKGRSSIWIGKIKPHKQGEVAVKGKFYAPEDSRIYFNAMLQYTPSNFNSVFQAKNQLGVKVKSSPIFLSVNAPLEAADGNDIEYVINYRNTSDREFKNLELVAEYPKGFVFQGASLCSFEDNKHCLLGDLAIGQEGEIKIQGEIKGFKDEKKIVKVFLRAAGNDGDSVIYSEKERITKIIASPLTISQAVNGFAETMNADQGENLHYVLTYRNSGEIGLRDVIITLEIKDEGSILDFSKIILEKGAYNSSEKTITWKAGTDIPELARLEAGAEGEINFSIPVKERIEINNENDKNFIVELVAKIDSPDVPFQLESNKIIASDKMTIKLNSKVILETKGYYNDSDITNTGPLPPRVGKETSYAIHWLVTNISNNISDVKVEAALPTWARWKNEIHPKDENIQFNPRTNKIVWDIGSLGSGTGILDYPKEVSFRVSVVPEINQAGDYIEILGGSTLTAKDEFTSKEIKEKTAAKDSVLKEDMSIDSSMYRVADAEEE